MPDAAMPDAAMPDVLLVCPSCHAEYVPGRTECSDCHVSLVSPTPEPDVILARDGVVVEATHDAAVARGWRDVLTAAGVPHRIEGAGEPGAAVRFTLLVGEADADRVSALADIVEEQPSVDADIAVRLARERVEDGPAEALEFDAAMFDVPDLLPPLGVHQKIEAAGVAASAGLALAVFLAFLSVAVSPWWAIPTGIALIESYRARRRARRLLAAWQQVSGWEPLP